MTVNTYDPSKVILMVGGYRLTGLTSVHVSWNAPAFKIVRGARGKNTRVASRDTGGKITINVLQTSLTNDILSDIVNQDRFKKSGRIEVTLRDISGMALIASQEAFIENNPDAEFKKGLSNRTWNIIMLSTDNAFLGSNIQTTPDNFN